MSRSTAGGGCPVLLQLWRKLLTSHSVLALRERHGIARWYRPVVRPGTRAGGRSAFRSAGRATPQSG
ncbi:hypothetical protein CgunFtcFv8_018214 [Champsocephalus gunnari]|uniref:Uncharacterized protein n=1 Tax=Champsocephalus gunnari TaxID=52237 RepID=A0AAN8DNT3_CHAGU|nr:hypothetical protein CgunFtcFv8_018214 [Champsocephalus gunnari]